MTTGYLTGKKAAILTLGCKVNQYESDAMHKLLMDAGVSMVEFDDPADIYIVNTCSVTNMADRKSRQMLHKAKKHNPDAVVVACGCYVQADAQHVLEDYAVDLVLGNNVKNNIVDLLEEYYARRQADGMPQMVDAETVPVTFMQDISRKADYEEMRATVPEMTRAYVKVQDGCNQFCSYCIIPYTRGRIRSRAMEDVIKEVSDLAMNGFREVVLTGIHLSSYGMDMAEHSSRLGELIGAVSSIDGIDRVRLGSLEPGIITEEFLQSLRENKKFCPHFHLSLQSACNETLKRMNRKYTIEQYMEKCDLIREYFDRPALTTDVIVGFPGETEEEFAVTVDNLERLALYEMHIFKFSPRKGTVAEKMPGQIPEPVKTKRSEQLLAMTARHKQAYEESFRDDMLEVLVEEMITQDGLQYASGHTDNYILVRFPSDADLVNQIVQVQNGKMLK